MEGISKKMRNRLSRWVRGLIDERLLFKAAVCGVRIAKVPAAYSSQCCPVCGYVHPKNRNGDQFCCQHCEHKNNADRVGALNLIARLGGSVFCSGARQRCDPKASAEKIRRILPTEGRATQRGSPAAKAGQASQEQENRLLNIIHQQHTVFYQKEGRIQTPALNREAWRKRKAFGKGLLRRSTGSTRTRAGCDGEQPKLGETVKHRRQRERQCRYRGHWTLPARVFGSVGEQKGTSGDW